MIDGVYFVDPDDPDPRRVVDATEDSEPSECLVVLFSHVSGGPETATG